MGSELKVISTDILIIGGGAAGACAAIEAGERGLSAIMLSKGPIAKSGTTPLGFTGYQAVNTGDPTDSPEIHFRDTVIGGRFLGNQDLVEVMCNEGATTVERLRGYGVKFQEENGAYLVRQVPGISRKRMLRIPAGGVHLHQVLRDRVKTFPSVKIMPDTAAVQILKQGGEAAGALIYDLARDEFFAVQARVTVIATGGNEQIFPYTDCPPETTGDGYVLAYEAGAELLDMEQELFYPTVAIYPNLIRGLELSYESYFRPSAKFLNGEGKEFMDMSPPVPTRDEMANRLFKEIHEGRAGPHGGIIIDLREANEELRTYLRKFLPALARLRYFDIDIFGEQIEVVPGAHTTLGGTRITPECRTRVPRLLAAGEAAGNVHGANRLAGQAWTDCVVFGFKSARTAEDILKAGGDVQLDRAEARAAAGRWTAYLQPRADRPRPYQVKKQIKDLAWKHIGLRRTAPALETGVARFRELQQELAVSGLHTSDAPGFNMDRLVAIQVHFMARAAEYMAAACLVREESRGTHFREEFPQRNDAEWLRHTVVRQEGGRLVTDTAPVIITRLRPQDVAATEVKEA